MDNMPILYQNIMLCFSTDVGRCAFLWATEKTENDPILYKAEAFAHEVEKQIEVIEPLFAASAKICAGQGIGDGQVPSGLMNFILKRHANQRFGGNLNPPYMEAA